MINHHQLSSIINHQSSSSSSSMWDSPKHKLPVADGKTAETHGSPKFKAYCGVVCSISILVGYANITQSRDISINFMLKLSSCRGKTHICSGVQCKSLKKKNTVVGVTSQLMQVPIKDQPTTDKPDPKS